MAKKAVKGGKPDSSSKSAARSRDGERRAHPAKTSVAAKQPANVHRLAHVVASTSAATRHKARPAPAASAASVVAKAAPRVSRVNGKPARIVPRQPSPATTTRPQPVKPPPPTTKVVLKAKKLRRDRVKEPPRPLVPLPPPPVLSDSKPKKNQAGLSVKELDTFRQLLLAKRRELLGDMSSMEREALQSGQGSNLSNLPVHMADMGTDNYEQEFTLGLVEKDRQLLREINRALAKIHDGTYGICEGTGKPINKQRLEIQPWARFSVEHARALEKNMMIRR